MSATMNPPLAASGLELGLELEPERPKPDLPPEPAEPAPAPALDHALFPHIMDAILRFSSPPTLLVFRRTSHGMREQVDAQFSQHIVVAATPTRTFLDITPHAAPLSLPLDLKRTRTIDLVGPIALPEITYRRSRNKTAHELYLDYLSTRVDAPLVRVRLRPDSAGNTPSACPLPTTHLVAFGQFAEPDAPHAPTPVPESVARLVLSLAYEPGAWWLPAAGVGMWALTHTPEEVVMILSPRAPRHGAGRAFGETAPRQWMGMMCGLVNLICLAPEARYTLVGVDALQPEWLGIEPEWGSPSSCGSWSASSWSGSYDWRTDSPVCLVQDALGAELRRRYGWDIDEVDAALQRVRFRTRAQYEKEVSPRQFELETCE